MTTTNLIQGLHHVTATVGEAQADYDFYTRLLALRLVKKTVNFDNNQVYHFYYGNEAGEPGTIMTTFPYEGQGIREGVIGTGQVSVTAFSVPKDAIGFWRDRLERAGVAVNQSDKFGNPTLQFRDPAGLILEITGNGEDVRSPWTTSEVSEAVAIRGFFAVTLSVAEVGPTLDFLCREFGFTKLKSEGRLTRLAIAGGGPGRYVDISGGGGLQAGKNGIGTVHHVAWRIANDEQLLAMRRRLTEDLGFRVTEVKDRNYFHSIYFRIPGHVLFEIATIPPGFTIDEPVDLLGMELKLPPWEEPNRQHIEHMLPMLNEGATSS